MDAQPNLILLAGPNGAGKSTASSRLLIGALEVHEFVNADVIAQGLSAFNPEAASLEAGRVMLRRLRHLTDLRVNVAFESTLASRSFAPWIRRLRDTGYNFHLFYYWLPTPEMAIQRVAHRKRLGGHTVPEETIRRRYDAGLRNFFSLYSPIADHWTFYDNSEPANPILIARGGSREECSVKDPVQWNILQVRASNNVRREDTDD
ncbi:MAG: zeta toxin family protein [Bryobacteraceae bacterium]